MSRRTQVRLLFQSIPSRDLAGTTLEALTSRCESYLAAVEVWAGKGNGKAVKQAGSGLVAICAWRAAKALAEDAQMEAFQRRSGLSSNQFVTSERELTPAIQSADVSRKMRSLPSTPNRDALQRPMDPALSSASSGSTPHDRTPEAMAKRARDVMSGAAFANSESSPLAQRHKLGPVDDKDGEGEAPDTPTRRTLRNRSNLKETRIFDPSEEMKTPTKRVHYPASTMLGSEGRQGQSHRALTERQTLVRSASAKKRRNNVVVGYPAGEPLWLGHSETMGEWDGRRSRERVQRYIAALQRHPGPPTGWGDDDIAGELNMGL